MCEGYHAARREGDPFSDLDEYLCEYVDGTMDPSVRRVFEEYIQANPALAEHVEELRATRSMLSHFGHRVHAPCWLQSRLRQQLGAEIMQAQAPYFSRLFRPLSQAVTFTSAMALMLALGMLAGERLADRAGEAPAPAARFGAAAPVGGASFRTVGFQPAWAAEAFAFSTPSDTARVPVEAARLQRIDARP